MINVIQVSKLKLYQRDVKNIILFKTFFSFGDCSVAIHNEFYINYKENIASF